MDFVKTPYLPQGKIALAVGAIERQDIKIIKPYCAKNLPEPLAYHADLTFCYLGSGQAVCAPEAYDYYQKAFEGTSLELIEGERRLDRHYPSDAAYNVAIVGSKIFCRIDITDRVLLNRAESLGYTIININQGYGKCSVCPVDATSAISADKSFIKAAQKEGINALPITNDTILLPGYTNGFFGGCSYMEDKSTLSAAGDITKHPDYSKIQNFLSEKNIQIKHTPGALFDFGSLIPVFEE